MVICSPKVLLACACRSLELEKQQLWERVASLASAPSMPGSEGAAASRIEREENAIRVLKHEVTALQQQLEVCLPVLHNIISSASDL